MYQEYYGLSEKPFNLTPDPRFLYLSQKHKEAFAHLMYGIQSRSGFVMVSGEIGTGKTTICRSLLKQLDSNIEVALIFNPYLSPEELLKHINQDFGIKSESTSLLDLLEELNTYLLDSATSGKTCVLIIDEAQNLSAEILEHIRLLSNLETEKEKLIQIMLIGQPELAVKLELYELRQLNQRITARYHLEALTEEETLHYVAFRLRVAGGRKMVRFTRKAIREVYKISQGTPRVINAVCDRTLLIGYTQETREITPKIVKLAAREIHGEGHTQKRSLNLLPALRVMLGLSFAAVAFLVVILFTSGRFPFWPSDTATRPRDTPTEQRPTHNPVLDQQVEAITTLPETTTTDLPQEDVPSVLTTLEKEVEQLTLPVPAEVAPTIDENTPVADIDLTTPIVSEESTLIASIPTEITETPAPAVEAVPPLLALGSLSALHDSLTVLLDAWGEKPVADLPDNARMDAIRTFGRAQNFVVSVLRATPQKLMNINLPMLIQIKHAERLHWVACLSADDGKVTLRMPDATTSTLSYDDLKTVYADQALVFWRDPYTYKQPLRLREQGEPVWVIQHDLASLGIRVKEPNGIFDAETVEAVKRIQRTCGLDLDGVLGGQTRMVLTSWLNKKNQPHLMSDAYPTVVRVALGQTIEATKTIDPTTPSAPLDGAADTTPTPDTAANIEAKASTEPQTYTPLINAQPKNTEEGLTDPTRSLVPLRPSVQDDETEEDTL